MASRKNRIAKGVQIAPGASELPLGWANAPVGEIIQSKQDGVWGPEAPNGCGFPVIRSTDMRGGRLSFNAVSKRIIPPDVAAKKALAQGDIIVTKSSGSPHLVGLPVIFEKPHKKAIYLCSNFTMRMRFLPNTIDSRYVLRFLTSAKMVADRTRLAQDTTGLRNLKVQEYLSQTVPVPPFKEQKRIVDKLEKLLEHIDSAEQSIERTAGILKQFRQSVLAAACAGKLVEQDPNDEPAPELLRRVRAERKKKWEKDLKLKGKDPKKVKYVDAPEPDIADLPHLPNGWKWTNLENTVRSFVTGPFGSMLHKSDYVMDGTPVINPANISDGKIAPVAKMAIGPKTLKRLDKYKLVTGDLIVARRGEMGRCAVVTGREEDWLCGTGSMILRLETGVDPNFVSIVVRGQSSRQFLSSESVGTTMENLNQRVLMSLRVPLPPTNEQNRILAKVEELFKLADSIEASVNKSRRHADKIKQSLLAKAFRGELVEQDPNDPPASELLEAIKKHKAIPLYKKGMGGRKGTSADR